LYLTTTTAPAGEPLGAAEAKLHLRLDGDDENELLDALITAARDVCETATHRAFITQTLELGLDCFPCEISVPRPKLQSVTSVKYLDTNGTLQTLASTEYTVDASSEPGRIKPAYGKYWPVTRKELNAVRISFKAGFGDDAEDVPATIRQAMLMLIAHLYENREPVNIGNIVNNLPMTVEFLLQPYKIYVF
jgi:uncharacterized phiE125 gp8 family phage protein